MLGETRYANNAAPQPPTVLIPKRSTSLSSLQGGGALNTPKRKSLDGSVFCVLKQAVSSILPSQSDAISNRSVRLSINTSNTPSIASPSAMSPSTVSPGSVMRSPTSPYENNIIKGKAIIYGNENKEEALGKYNYFLENFREAEYNSVSKKTFCYHYKYEKFFDGKNTKFLHEFTEIMEIDLTKDSDVEFIKQEFIDKCSPDKSELKEFLSTLCSIRDDLVCRDSLKDEVSVKDALGSFFKKKVAIKKYDDFIENFSVAEDHSIKEKTFVFCYEDSPKYDNHYSGENVQSMKERIKRRDIDLNDNADIEFVIKKFIDNCNPDEATEKEFGSALYLMGQGLNYKNIKEAINICKDSCKNNVSPNVELQKFLDSIKKDIDSDGKFSRFKKGNYFEKNSNYEKCVNSFRKDKKNGEKELEKLSCRWLSYKELEVHTVGLFSIKRKKYININKKSGIREVAKIFSSQCNFNKIEKEIFYKKLKYRVNAVKLGSASFDRKSFITTLESFGGMRNASNFDKFVNSR